MDKLALKQISNTRRWECLNTQSVVACSHNVVFTCTAGSLVYRDSRQAEPSTPFCAVSPALHQASPPGYTKQVSPKLQLFTSWGTRQRHTCCHYKQHITEARNDVGLGTKGENMFSITTTHGRHSKAVFGVHVSIRRLILHLAAKGLDVATRGRTYKQCSDAWLTRHWALSCTLPLQ